MVNHTPEEPPLRYFLPGRKIGLPDPGSYLYVLASSVLWVGVLPLASMVLAQVRARKPQHRLERWWARGVRAALKIDLVLEGLEHIDPNEVYVVTPLHEGFVDVVALLHLPLPLRFAARDELFTWRLLGCYLRASGQIEVCPERGSQSYRHLLRDARKVIAAGESLLIFPQGGLLGIELDCRAGAFALARSLRRPILPVVLTGTHRVWEYPFTPRLRFGQRVTLRVLPPLPVEEHSGREASKSLEKVRREVQQRLKTVALSGEVEPPRRFVPARDGYWDGYAYTIDPDFPDLAADIARRRAAAASQRSDSLSHHPPDRLEPPPR